MSDMLPNPVQIEMTAADLAPWNGATVEQVRDAFLEGRVVAIALSPEAQKTTGPMLKACIEDARGAVAMGRMIDAGHLPNAIIKAEAVRAKPLVCGGWLRHPFDDPWVLFHTWEDGAAPLLVIPASEDGRVTVICEFVPALMRGARMLLVGDVGELISGVQSDGELGFFANIQCAPMRLLAAKADEPDDAMKREAACNLGDPVWTALAMLATDGVEVETIPAPERLNKQRVAKGKHPIPSWQRVNSKPYITALLARRSGARRGPGGGHHASPVMHVRRGHLRRLEDGRQIWVRDCIVNAADGSPVVRSHYAMKPGKQENR